MINVPVRHSFERNFKLICPFKLHLLVNLILIFGISACKPAEITSTFAEDLSVAAPVPGKSAYESVSMNRGISLNGGGCSGGSCPSKTYSSASENAKNPTSSTTSSSSSSSTQEKAGTSEVGFKAEIDSKAKKLYDPKKEMYYLPVKNSSSGSLYQAFDAKTNQATGWYWNRNDGILARNIDFTDDGKMKYKDDSDIYRMKQFVEKAGKRQGWEGTALKYDSSDNYEKAQLKETGLKYYFIQSAQKQTSGTSGKASSPSNGAKPWQEAYHVYNVDTFKSVYGARNTEISGYFEDSLTNNEFKKGVWFNSPPQSGDVGSLDRSKITQPPLIVTALQWLDSLTNNNSSRNSSIQNTPP